MIPVCRRAVHIGFLLLLSLFLPLPVEPQDVLPEGVSDQAGSQKGLSFQLKEGLLSVNIREVPLNEALKAIAEKAGIEVVLFEPAEEKISLEFTGLPVDKGLKRILKGRGYLFLYGRRDSPLKTVEVYSRDNEAQAQEGQPTVEAKGSQPDRQADRAEDVRDSEREFQEMAYRALGDSDPEARLDAVEDLGSEEDEERAADTLALVLEREQDAKIRKAALDAMSDFDEEGGLPLMAALTSLNDPVQEIRLQAVEILDDLEAWDELRRVARSHYDPDTRKIAAEALNDEPQ
jgi:hypothetical protein